MATERERLCENLVGFLARLEANTGNTDFPLSAREEFSAAVKMLRVAWEGLEFYVYTESYDTDGISGQLPDNSVLWDRGKTAGRVLMEMDRLAGKASDESSVRAAPRE